jgi:alkanesulfonate monooxygenase SsuD/methylene tetrahydromethanopterin reductase-like flavin-dependent oxidoreductase (luciferase family)
MQTHREAFPVRVGALVWPQGGTWDEMEATAQLADHVGLDSLWAWDHLHAIVGDPLQPCFEGWSTLAAWAATSSRISLGLMVGANTLRNPGLTAKTAVTVDHISKGRTWLGIGGAWFEYEHKAHGIEFGESMGQRLDWMEESVRAIKLLTRGEAVTSEPGDAYAFRDLQHQPLPYHGPGTLPVLIGGTGERKTLRSVARHAQAWNAGGSLEFLRAKVEVLRRHCEAAGRDPLEIEFTTNRRFVLRDSRDEAERAYAELMTYNDAPTAPVAGVDFLGTEEDAAEAWTPYLELGFTHVIADVMAPYDQETIERLPGVRDLVASG